VRLVRFVFVSIKSDRLIIRIKAANVEAAGGHGPSVHSGVLDHIVSEVARGILATAVLYRMTHQVEVFLPIYIERWDCPMGLGNLGLLFHAEDAIVGIELYDTRALELLDGGLLVTHDAGGAFGFGEIDELLKTKEQQVVGSHYQQIIKTL
jgi:hypothetical protein